MKREVRREKILPAFALEIGDLESLLKRLLTLFDKPDDVYCSIDITLPSENLKFNNIKEFKEYSALPSRITKFAFRLTQDNRYVSIITDQFFRSRPEVSASADSEAWCAGAVETVYSFILANKLWYSWFVSAPIGLIFSAFAYISIITYMLLPKSQFFGESIFLAWLLITITLGILDGVKSKLLPSSILIVTQEERFIHRYLGELSLIISIISAILVVVGWFVAK